ncbi:DNA-binding response regulator, OmpR family, contains REC and winged-helix (wHTH) domain [Caloranaerobacter azorensis DSM 13643]|uniref:DNA-binding response regulator, OmpR family, contains REC and winged-helix (WHTH) domain n=1 Tax=Caloranaerobacter azorensis DSM 13643 TaxID=1121264 RepID=A0A1M5W190_9FIRM|nr:response regulator transcription factor [Caloranaerobacter azorensis]SHH81231.1 DNA-binding response regulator, OmpR family, contains REC and winged-helix (wHTH) domain [Caloranaerobacter azorensis DSM 13643]
MKEKILIADDEEDIVSFIKDFLEEDYEILCAYNGEEAIEKAKCNPDLILLDVMMPNLNGYEVCSIIRDIVSCPIIFLTAKHEEQDIIRGLTIGGDDYIAKPFSLRELKVRIEAHLRREKRSYNNKRARLYFGDLSIDLKGNKVYFKNEIIHMTKKEYKIVEFLAINCGQVFSKEQIYEKIWGYDAEGDASVVAEHVKKIRQKISEYDSKRDYIKTVWGVGYRWEKWSM